jgi:hypothetical protein
MGKSVNFRATTEKCPALMLGLVAASGEFGQGKSFSSTDKSDQGLLT